MGTVGADLVSSEEEVHRLSFDIDVGRERSEVSEGAETDRKASADRSKYVGRRERSEANSLHSSLQEAEVQRERLLGKLK